MTPLNVGILILVGALLAFGDFAMKSWVESGNLRTNIAWYVFAIVVYVIGLSFYGYTLKSVDFAAASYAILLFNMIFVAVVGYTYFGDTLSAYEFVGIILGIAAVTLFAFSRV